MPESSSSSTPTLLAELKASPANGLRNIALSGLPVELRDDIAEIVRALPPLETGDGAGVDEKVLSSLARRLTPPPLFAALPEELLYAPKSVRAKEMRESAHAFRAESGASPNHHHSLCPVSTFTFSLIDLLFLIQLE